MAESDPSVGVPLVGAMDQLSAHLDRGWDLIERGDLPGAVLSAEQSVELDPQSPEAHNLLGYVRATAGQAQEALEQYQQALALDETFVEAMLNAAEVLIHPLHDFEGAVRMAEEVLELAESNDEMAEALLLQFDARMHEGDEAAARNVVKRMPEGPFDVTRLDFMVARAHFEAGMVDRARKMLEKGLQKDTTNADGHYYMGLIHEAAGEHAQAVARFLHARELDLHTVDAPWAITADAFETVVRGAVDSLPAALQSLMETTMVLVGDLPGMELVADGVDPRAGLVLDGLSTEGEAPQVGRVFIYKRNLERMGNRVEDLQAELAALLTEELKMSFPSQLQ